MTATKSELEQEMIRRIKDGTVPNCSKPAIRVLYDMLETKIDDWVNDYHFSNKSGLYGTDIPFWIILLENIIDEARTSHRKREFSNDTQLADAVVKRAIEKTKESVIDNTLDCWEIIENSHFVEYRIYLMDSLFTLRNGRYDFTQLTKTGLEIKNLDIGLSVVGSNRYNSRYNINSIANKHSNR